MPTPNSANGSASVEPQQFATTRWSLVHRAGQSASENSRAALESLCQLYWYPLYAYVRRKGHQREDAQDIIQAFITSLLEHNAVSRADPGLGRFRSFLLGGLNKFLVDWHRHQRAQKRGGGRRVFSIDADAAESRYRREPIDKLTPERVFEKQWALTLLDSALSQLKQDYDSSGKSELFQALRPHLGMAAKRIPYRQIGENLGKTAGSVKVAAHRMRKRYREILRREIAETVASADELEEELSELFRSLAD